jgi:hypothetical protein
MRTSHFHLPSVVRGLYKRVSDKLGVDPSYVSRVARGERRSAKIDASLNREISKLLKSASMIKAKAKKKRGRVEQKASFR